MQFVNGRATLHKIASIMQGIETSCNVVLVEEEVMLGQIKSLYLEEDHHSSNLQEDHGEIEIIRTIKEGEIGFSPM